MKATRTIELGKGATLEITSELNVLKTESDSWEGIPAGFWRERKMTIERLKDGELGKTGFMCGFGVEYA